MKKFISILCTLVLLSALSHPVRADAIWTPDNSFFEKHYEECTSVGRCYLANGPEGYVTLWDAPGGSVVQGQYENGEALWVYWLYRDWGCVAVFGEDKRVEGWVAMEDLLLRYDYLSFAEEYAEQIKEYNGEFADYSGDAEAVVFYEYPGAEGYKRRIETADFSEALGNLTGAAGAPSYIQSIFVDEEGHTWGFVGYMYGHVDGWFCLDEPDGEAFPLREVRNGELTPAQTPRLPGKGYLPYILVVAVVAATGGILFVFFRKKTGSRE